MSLNRSVVFYHGEGCPDGAASAWVAKEAIPECDLIGLNHTQARDREFLLSKFDTGTNVYFLDICPPRELLIDISSLSLKTLVLDHHISAERHCSDLPYCRFDSTLAGCELAWEYFFPGKQKPKAISAIGQVDTWNVTIPWARDFHAYIGSLNNIEEVFFALTLASELPDTYIKKFSYKGNQIRENKIYNIERRPTHLLRINGKEIPCVHGNLRDVGEISLYLEKSFSTFAIIQPTIGGMVKVSLRSSECDVSKIASEFGGGGHACAAGFSVSEHELKKMLVDISA